VTRAVLPARFITDWVDKIYSLFQDGSIRL
jgi:hypothetical protein